MCNFVSASQQLVNRVSIKPTVAYLTVTFCLPQTVNVYVYMSHSRNVCWIQCF